MPDKAQTDLKNTLLEVFLGPFRRMLQNEVVFALILMLTAGGYAMYYIDLRAEDEKHLDRIERLTIGKKTAGSGSSPITESSP